MYKRVVTGVATLLFALLAVMMGIITDLHDRSFPQELGASSALAIDTSGSGLSDEEVFHRLGALSDRWALGLVKVTPDPAAGRSGQAFVSVSGQDHPSTTVHRFGDQPDARVLGPEGLAHSFATGDYLITGNREHVSDFKSWLSTHRIGVRWVDDTLTGTLALVIRQASFAVSLLAVLALMVALVLYWLTVKARGRALRVLGGVSTRRIQFEDLGGFLAALLPAVVVCDVVAITYLGQAQGWVFVPYYALMLLIFEGLVLLATMLCAFAMSLMSWPSTQMLARREPTVASLRRASTLLKVVTFTMVLAVVGPAVSAYTDARDAAAEQSVWNSLADQVVITFPAALGETGFQRITQQVGDVVKAAEQQDAVALSYTITDSDGAGASFGPTHHLSLVNHKWLDLVLGQSPGGSAGQHKAGSLVKLEPQELPAGVQEYVGANLELWARQRLPADQAMAKFAFYRYDGPGKIPLSMAGMGNLVLLDKAIIMVAPNLSELFKDDFLASIATSNNLVFAGLGPTTALVNEHGLQHQVFVKHIAEQGILRAQLTAYFAWLQVVSLVAITIALVMSAAIGALITALVKARRDFPLRLAGRRWREILAGRVVNEWLVGASLALVILLLSGSEGAVLVAAVAAAGMLASPVVHLLATRWNFTNISLRKF